MGSLHSKMLVLLYYCNSFQVNRKMLKHGNIFKKLKGYEMVKRYLAMGILK